MNKTELEHKINEESAISCVSEDGAQLTFWVNTRNELSMCITNTDNKSRDDSVSFDLAKCQQLRQVLDLYEQYLKA